MTMTTYHCEGFRPITQGIGPDAVESEKGAAWIFAARLARRTLGSRAKCMNVLPGAMRRDGTYSVFECYLGLPSTDENATAVRRVNIYVDVKD